MWCVFWCWSCWCYWLNWRRSADLARGDVVSVIVVAGGIGGDKIWSVFDVIAVVSLDGNRFNSRI